MPSTADMDHFIEQLFVVLLVGHEVHGGRIDDEQRGGSVVMEEPRIRVGKPLEIPSLDLLLVANTATRDTLEQNICRRLAFVF